MQAVIDRQKIADEIRRYGDADYGTAKDGVRLLTESINVNEKAAQFVIGTLKIALKDAGLYDGVEHPCDITRLIADLIDPTCEADYVGDFRCTRCGGWLGDQIHCVPDYCPHCGARLERK